MEDNKHLDVVWEIDWAQKLQKTGTSEQLISISSDGKVNEWNIKKGLECNELKLIAHQQNPLFKSKNNKKTRTRAIRRVSAFPQDIQ